MALIMKLETNVDVISERTVIRTFLCIFLLLQYYGTDCIVPALSNDFLA